MQYVQNPSDFEWEETFHIVQTGRWQPPCCDVGDADKVCHVLMFGKMPFCASVNHVANSVYTHGNTVYMWQYCVNVATL